MLKTRPKNGDGGGIVMKNFDEVMFEINGEWYEGVFLGWRGKFALVFDTINQEEALSEKVFLK